MSSFADMPIIVGNVTKRVLRRDFLIRRCSSVITTENVFSERNKHRVQQKLLTTNPVREVPAWAKGREMKKAAVLVPICTVNGEPSVLFTVRSSDLTHHKGEVRQVKFIGI